MRLETRKGKEGGEERADTVPRNMGMRSIGPGGSSGGTARWLFEGGTVMRDRDGDADEQSVWLQP